MDSPKEQWEVNLLLKRCLQSSQSCIKHLLCCDGMQEKDWLALVLVALTMHGYLPWPSILVLDLVLIKRTGHGVAGIVLPEKEEKVLAIRKGDAIALPFGVVTWWYNKEDTELVVLFLGDTSKGHKAGSFTDFFLTGSNRIFNGFSTEFVSRAWDLEENVVKTMVGKQTGNVNCDLQQKPSFELSGKLATETNSVRGAKWLLVVLATASEDGDDDDNSVTET
ncbi:Glutelin type-A 2 [Camellia lanceoleosa]|uniref:Glutelin type-A 2 n=1 Tax=Camellia lanceoleosa TaxID=1840588 RepID=A0ACC0HTA8_9ERIC|nr:Glutelin type-A 2 [Camellia lanceoleosa]